jgi:homoserine/homoserine lactone efflux protein
MSSQSLLLYFATWLLLALTPGPAVICVMSQATRYGWQAGFRGILGIQLGNFVFFLCIAFGLTALLATATHAFVILQLAGAVYLLYLGLRIIISSLRPSADALQGFGLGAERRKLVAQALFVQLTNPKALLFVSALLPQFLDPHRPMASQLAILLSCTVVIDAAVLGSYVLLAHHGMRAIRHSQVSRWIECTFGAALILLGIRLLEWRK